MNAFIAHDHKKTRMLEFVREHVDFFRSPRLVAAGNKCKLLAEQLDLEVERVMHDRNGATELPRETLRRCFFSAIL